MSLSSGHRLPLVAVPSTVCFMEWPDRVSVTLATFLVLLRLSSLSKQCTRTTGERLIPAGVDSPYRLAGVGLSAFSNADQIIPEDSHPVCRRRLIHPSSCIPADTTTSHEVLLLFSCSFARSFRGPLPSKALCSINGNCCLHHHGHLILCGCRSTWNKRRYRLYDNDPAVQRATATNRY